MINDHVVGRREAEPSVVVIVNPVAGTWDWQKQCTARPYNLFIYVRFGRAFFKGRSFVPLRQNSGLEVRQGVVPQGKLMSAT
jgi:hypothetical protein